MIGGKVFDSSTLAAYIRDNIAVASWITVAHQTGIVLYVPAFAVTEVAEFMPHAATKLDKLMRMSVVIRGRLTTPTAATVGRLLADIDVWDPLAGWVVHEARQRGWPVLTDDAGRLHRIDPALPVETV